MRPLGLLDRLIFILLYKIKKNFFKKFLLYILIIDIVTIIILGSFDQPIRALYILSFLVLLPEYYFICNDFKNEFERYDNYLELKENKYLLANNYKKK